MTPSRPWPAGLAEATGRQLRILRKQRQMTATDVAEKMSRLGMPYTRAQVTNLEANRRTSVTVGEIVAFAALLGVPPALLIAPIGSQDPIEVLPDHSVDAWTAYGWFTGLGTDTDDLPGQRPHFSDDTALRFNAYRTHDLAVMTLRMTVAGLEHEDPKERQFTERSIRDKVETVVARRDAIRARGWLPPPLPLEIRPMVEAAEKEIGL